MDVRQFVNYVIKPTLEKIQLDSPAAVKLLLGTALVESGELYYLKQLGNGPALGLYQIEPATHDDVWDNFLQFRKELRRDVLSFLAPVPEPKEQLITNLAYSTVMARLVYYRVKAGLPPHDDHRALAGYWKLYYNTPKGKGDPEKFKTLLDRVV